MNGKWLVYLLVYMLHTIYIIIYIHNNIYIYKEREREHMMLCHVSGNMTPRLLVFLVASKKWWGSLAAEKNRSRDSMCAMEWEGMVQDFPRDPRWEGKQVRQASVLKVFFPPNPLIFSPWSTSPKCSQISWKVSWGRLSFGCIDHPWPLRKHPRVSNFDSLKP